MFAITRHPMMWGFALWAVVHAIVNPTPASLVLSAAIAFLALVGAALQDCKKARLLGDVWRDWQAQTSFRALRQGLASRPDAFALVAGTIALARRDLGAWRARLSARGHLGLFRLKP